MPFNRQAMASPTNQSIDLIRQTFPSLPQAVECLKDAPYDVGWLLGTLSDVASCLLWPIVHGATDITLNPAKTVATGYLQQHGYVDADTLFSAASLIKIEELIALLRSLCEQVSAFNATQHLADAGHDATQTTIAVLCDLDDRFNTLFYQTAYALLFHDSTDQSLVDLMENGWEDGRSAKFYPPRILTPELSDPILARREDDDMLRDGTPLQFQPDETSTEHTATGSPVPRHEFCSQYTVPRAPDGVCPICQESYVGGFTAVNADLVVARCAAEHAFHGECLDEWVNGSAMLNSNTCPVDRERICRARDVVHVAGLMVPMEERG
jgi:hypothetical protein